MNIKKLLKFLSDLKENNDRNWFNQNKSIYNDLRNEFLEFVRILIEKISEFDEDIVNLQPEDCIFRIYRDIRFTSDKTPYKTNFGAFIAKGGRKLERAGYYVHFEPGDCFLAGGIYRPSNEILKKIRNEIYYNIEEFLKIINNKEFVAYFKTIDGEKLVKVPIDFPSDFEYGELLKYKSYNIVYDMNEKFLFDKNLVNNIISILKLMYPFNKFINEAIDN